MYFFKFSLLRLALLLVLGAINSKCASYDVELSSDVAEPSDNVAEPSDDVAELSDNVVEPSDSRDVSLWTRADAEGTPITVDNCPVLAKADCQASDPSTCECKGLKIRNRGGKYSCPNSTCQFCAKKFKHCIADTKPFPCCDQGAGNTLGCYKALQKYDYQYFCLPTCHRFNLFETCTDVNGRAFSASYKCCKGRSAYTFSECATLGDTAVPTDCGATNALCDFWAKRDSCCDNFRCDESGTCQAECKDKEKDCKPRLDKGRCYTNAKFFDCTDKDGRTFSSPPGKYLGCRAQDKKKNNTWYECPGRGNRQDPRECGATGASCTKNVTGTFVDDCCTGFECVKGTCKPECPPNPKNCTINLTKKPCTYADSVKTKPCKVNGRSYEFRYLKCNGVKPNNATTILECGFDPRDPARECGITGASCDFLSPVDSCCVRFKCNVRSKKCEPECSSESEPPSNENDTHCNTALSKNRCDNLRIYETCKVNGTSYYARYLNCEGPDPKDTTTFVECPRRPDYKRPRTCSIPGVKGCTQPPNFFTAGSCCRGFKCDDKNSTCIAA